MSTATLSAPSVASLSPSQRASLAADVLERIQAIREQYKREVGLSLSTADAIQEWARRETGLAPVDGDAGLEPADLEPVACRLAELGYSPQAIRGALADIGRCGSAECTPYLDPEDRAAIEELIPEASADAWKGPKRKGVLWGRMVAR